MRRRKKHRWILFIPLAMAAFAVFFMIRELRLPAEIPYMRGSASYRAEGDWKTVLVNADHPLPADYSVSLLRLDNGEYVDERIWPELQEMFDTARSQGISLYVRSGWRSAEDQQAIMDEMIAQYIEEGYSREAAEAEAREWVAAPGTSEHETGLAVDINAEEEAGSLRTYNWLKDNAHLYGFIQRYPEEKSSLTGIAYEPWHYRYVGKEAAAEIYDSGLCLEEYQSSQR
ncbi:MAG: M15 family metallopeptidase [Solobacterium sp.]|nr:M15 family metallopeptidase [Solobacterium sp.]